MEIVVPNDGPKSGVVFRVSNEIVATGDWCDLYNGTYESDGTIRPAIFKRARDGEGLDRLDHERKILNTFWAAIKDQNWPFFGHTLPKHFGRAGDGVLDFHVLEKCEGYTVETLKSYFPTGLPPVQAAWMLTRFLTTLAAAHQLGWAHCSSLPQHLLVKWDNVKQYRFATVLDWTSATKIGDKFPEINPKYALFYPPEAWSGGEVTAASDLFMFGQVANYLLGGDLKNRKVPESVPRQLRGIIHSCLIPSALRRSSDASDLLLNHLRPALAEIWGSPKYVDFQIPQQASA